jgi:hypothetical protein
MDPQCLAALQWLIIEVGGRITTGLKCFYSPPHTITNPPRLHQDSVHYTARRPIRCPLPQDKPATRNLDYKVKQQNYGLGCSLCTYPVVAG